MCNKLKEKRVFFNNRAYLKLRYQNCTFSDLYITNNKPNLSGKKFTKSTFYYYTNIIMLYKLHISRHIITYNILYEIYALY